MTANAMLTAAVVSPSTATATATATAAALGLVACQACRLVVRTNDEAEGACPRCGVRLRSRKPSSLARTTAFLLTSALLFAPANLMPVMTTRTLLKQTSDTILTGVIALWMAGSWFLSVLVFLASVVVPGLKICALTLLVLTTRRRSMWRQCERTRLYRLLERVGRWSMLDIFVMAFLAALVRSRVATVHIEWGAVVFAAVVVFTMLASTSFDPRLIWDTTAADRPLPQGTTP